jgi:hypothetical protein
MINHTRPSHFTTAILLLLASALQAQTKYPLRGAVECHPRNGLPNFLAKVEAGKARTIQKLIRRENVAIATICCHQVLAFSSDTPAVVDILPDKLDAELNC